MGKVAGVLVDDAQWARRAPSSGLRGLAHVADAGRECLGAVRPEGIRGQELAVVLEMRAAPGRIHDDLRVASGEGVDVEPRELPRPLTVAGVRMQGAAAHLLLRHADPQSVAFEQAHGRTLGLAERFAHDAAGEDARFRLGPLRATECGALAARRERRRPAETAGEARGEPSQADPTGEPSDPTEERESSAIRDRVEHRANDRAVRFALPQDFARAFHDPAEGHARPARCLARTTAQARLEVPDRRRARRVSACHDAADQLNATARRVRLLTANAIGPAIVQTQATRDARGEIAWSHMG